MTCGGIRRLHVLLIVLSIGVGLAIDARSDLPGQLAVSAAVWIILIYVLRSVAPLERRTLFACLFIATIGELFLSLVWGLYTYRLDNVPFFVPPGHVMLLVLAIALSQRLTQRAAAIVLIGAGIYALAAAAAGLDTLAVPLMLLLGAVAIAMPQHLRLYASTFLLALALELYGTWLGNWTWAREVPVVELVTTNPPALASAFYAVLDALVACTVFLFARRMHAPSLRHA